MEPTIINRRKKKVLHRQTLTTTSIVCGTENPVSLGCVFYELEGGEVAAEFVPGQLNEGHENIMHGGFTAAVLDEAMGRANRSYDKMVGDPREAVFSAEITVTYLQPVPVGQRMRVFGRIEKKEGRKRWASAELLNEDDLLMAKSRGLYISAHIIDGNYAESKKHFSEDPEEL